MIALIDYGAGNLTSVRKALSALGAEFTTPRDPSELMTWSGVIIPGVGHFEATAAIDEPWRAAIRGALDRGSALLGICLGMQWLFEGSDEAPALSGLGTLRGTCARLNGPRLCSPDNVSLKVPHVGWNTLELPRTTTLMRGVGQNAQVYFTHSYAAPVVAESAAITTHGAVFSSAVERHRVAGVQFHPEKSGDVGLRILKNWLDAL